jgi:hypothetical protein
MAALKMAGQQIDEAAQEMKKMGMSADQVAIAQKAMTAEVIKSIPAITQQNDVAAMAARSFAILRGETEKTSTSMRNVTGALTPLTVAFRDVLSLYKESNPIMTALASAFDSLIISTTAMVIQTGSLSAALAAFMGPIGLITAGIIALSAAIVYFVAKSKEAEKAQKEFQKEVDRTADFVNRANQAAMRSGMTSDRDKLRFDQLVKLNDILMKTNDAELQRLAIEANAKDTAAALAEFDRKAGEESAKRYNSARDAIVSQIETTRTQVKEFEEGKAAAIDYEMSILLVSDNVKLLGKEGKYLVGVLKEEKLAFEDLKSTQKLYDEAGKQAIKQFEDGSKQSENFVKGLEDIQDALQLQGGARSLKQIIGPLDQLEQKLIDLFAPIENLDVEGARTFGRLYDEIQKLKSIKVGAALGEDIAKLKQQTQGFAIQAMPEGANKQIAEVNVQFENQRIALEKLIVDYRAFPEVVAAAQEALLALNVANTKVLQSMTPMMRIFDAMASTIEQAIDTTLAGVMQGTQTLGEAMKNMARNIMMAFVSELNKQFIIAPLMQGLKGLLSGGLGGLLGGGSGAGPINLAGISNADLGWTGSIAGLQTMAGGGIVAGPRGQAVPIIAHAGERIVPLGQREGMGNQSNVQVKIMGDVVPREPTMRKEDVIQIGLSQFEDRGVWQQSLEQRMSPRR